MFPVLEGSEKQIRWATSIRKEMTEVWKRSDSEAYEALGLENETKASWWIANRQHVLIDGALRPHNVNGAASVKGYSPALSPTESEKTYEACPDGGCIHIGGLRNMLTGELVVDPECPF